MNRFDQTNQGSPTLKLRMTGRGKDAMRMEKRLRCAGRALGVDVQVDWDARKRLSPCDRGQAEFHHHGRRNHWRPGLGQPVADLRCPAQFQRWHLWKVAEHDIHFEGHVVLEDQPLHDTESIRVAIEETLHERFDINHSTLQIEPPDGQCATAELA